jgi:hypothetical protein
MTLQNIRFSSTCIEKPINKKSITFEKEKIAFTIKKIKEDNVDQMQSAEVRDIRKSMNNYKHRSKGREL